MKRRRWILIALVVILLIAFFPMRLALAGLGSNALAGVRTVSGSVWDGTLRGVTAGEIVLGDFSAKLSPWWLPLGRGYVHLRSLDDPALKGTLFASFWNWGMRDMDARLSLQGAFAPLPVESLELTGAGVRFVGDACAQATGQLRVTLRGSINGVAVDQSMIGPLRCDGKSVAALLVSASAMERVSLRVTPDGAYAARLNVRASDPAAALKFSQAGFRDTPLGYEFAFSGRF